MSSSIQSPLTQSVQSTLQNFEPLEPTVNITTDTNDSYGFLPFPWNAYAQAALLQENKVIGLHYGLFFEKTTSYSQAQQSAIALLLNKLPVDPCHILLIDQNFDVLSLQIIEQGHTLHKISDLNINSNSKNIPLDLAELKEDLDVILRHESISHSDPLAIFNQALDLLTPSGSMIVLDEFVFKPSQTEEQKLPLLNDFIALGERLGFELIEQQDLSELAAPTLDCRLAAISTHRENLLEKLNLTPEQLTQLKEWNRIKRHHFAASYYGYALLHFKKTVMPKWRIHFLRNEHRPQMQDLFSRIFQQEMPNALWQWKYATENSCAISAWRDDKLVGHYGGIGRSILFFNKPENAVQIGDIMVESREHRSLIRKGPFFLMASTFLERYIGYGKHYLIGFGFPNIRSMKIAEKLGFYGEVGEMVELSWQPQYRSPLVKTNLKPIDRATKSNIKAVNQCWQKMASNMQTSIIGVRDWNYVLKRYLNHPTQSYQIILVKNRLFPSPRGVLILRYDNEECEIIDIIAPLAEIPLLITQARRLAALSNSSRLFCRITANFVSCFEHTDAIEQLMPIKIPTNIWSDGPAAETLKNRWWLMGGDMDFR